MNQRDRLDALDTGLLARGATIFMALSGTANVVMQLSRPEIGHAVKDSPVTEAALFENPRRRQRTTAGYLAVAAYGTAGERAAFRKATNVSHAQVRSAFDADLQLWVGACLFHGFERAAEAVYGPLVGEERAEFYGQGVLLGAMLQLPPERWPADREAFEDYWRERLTQVRIDASVRDYLLRVIRLDYLGRTIPDPVIRLRFWLTTGFLPEEFRAAMRLSWSERDEARFRRFEQRLGRAVRLLPPRWRGWPLTRALRDVRRRRAAGLPLFE